MKKLLSIICAVALMLTFATFPTFADESVSEGQLIKYPTYPEELPRNYDYEVTVTQGDKTIELPVYNASRQIDTYHNVEGTDSYRRFCEFAFEGEVEISVTTKLPMESYAILPSSKGIESTVSGNTITFTLTQPEDLLVRLNESDNTILSIFAEAPETDVPLETDENVIYFKAGYNNISEYSADKWVVTEDGSVRVPADHTVYLEPGALVSARLYVRDAHITVKGRGSFIDSRLDRNDSNYTYMFRAQKHSYGEDVTDITLEDVRFLDAHTFNVCLSSVSDANVDSIKILASQISSDGISLWSNCSDITVDNVFMYVNDNAFVNSSATNVTITNCTVGTNHGIFYPQGSIDSLTFDGVDIFSMGNFFRATMAASAERTWNITAKNIRAEDALTMSALIYLSQQSSGTKNVTFENVSLPANKNYVYLFNSTGLNFTFNNTYIGGVPFTSTDILTSDSKYTDAAITFNFGTAFDSAAAGVGIYASNLQSASYAGADVVKIGGYTVPFGEGTVTVKNNVTYLPAISALEALGYEAEYKNGTLTLADENGVITLESDVKEINLFGLWVSVADAMTLIDGIPMLPISFFTDVLELSATYADNTVTFEAPYGDNLIKDGGFEGIHNTILAEGKNHAASPDWTHYNFGNMFELSDPELVYAGNYSMHFSKDIDYVKSGLVQYFTPAIKTYGAGTYYFEFYARLGTVTEPTSANIHVGISQAGYNRIDEDGNLQGISDFKEYTLTNEWEKIVCEIVITDSTLDGYDRAFFFVGPSSLTDGTADPMDFYIDEVKAYYTRTVSSTAELTALLNEDAPTSEGEVFKGWYDSEGNLYTKTSTVSGTVNLHPEFVILGEAMNGYVGESEHDTNPVPATAKYINGMYLQGAQVRVGGDDVTTGLRFITVNNVDMDAMLKEAGFTNITHGTLVAAKSNLTSIKFEFGEPKASDVVAERIWHTAEALGTNYQKYTACVTNIEKPNFEKDIAARPYIKYTDLSGVERVLYGEQYACDLLTIAKAAYNSPYESDETKNYIYHKILSLLGVDNDTELDW